MKEQLYRISGLIPRPGDNLSIVLESLSGKQPDYQAGQFLTLVFRDGGRELRRSYSFNSSPHVDEPLSITVKRIENGEISRYLHHRIGVGDILTGLEPQGQFSYLPDPEINRTVFLFAAGVGITPLFSIMKTALTVEKNTRVVLVFSNNSPENTPFADEIREWENAFPERLKVFWFFSNQKNLLKARLNRFNLEELVLKNLLYPRENALFYTCGPVIYMDMCRITLLGMGFQPEQIRRETFLLPENEEDEDDTTEKKIDTTTYSVKILKGEKSYQLMVPFHHTILDEALKEGINLPYSCRSGICSTCVSVCVSGSVRMDYNEVLSEQEVSEGKMLVCTAHPTQHNTVILVEI